MIESSASARRGVVDTYRYAFAIVWSRPRPILPATAIWILALLLFSGTVQPDGDAVPALFSTSSILEAIVGGPLWVGICGIALGLLREGGEPRLRDLLIPFRRAWIDCAIGSFLFVAAVTLGLLLFVAPGLYIGTRLSFWGHRLAERGEGPLEAFRESWRMTRGQVWYLLRLYAAGIPICLAGLALLVIGIVPAISLVALAATLAYRDLAPVPREEESADPLAIA